MDQRSTSHICIFRLEIQFSLATTNRRICNKQPHIFARFHGTMPFYEDMGINLDGAEPKRIMINWKTGVSIYHRPLGPASARNAQHDATEVLSRPLYVCVRLSLPRSRCCCPCHMLSRALFLYVCVCVCVCCPVLLCLSQSCLSPSFSTRSASLWLALSIELT